MSPTLRFAIPARRLTRRRLSSFHTFSTSAPTNKVAAITGASRGIGRAIALRLAQDYDIAITDLSTTKSALEDVKSDIIALGKRCSVSMGDVSNEGDVKSFVDKTVWELGALDVMVANAGMCAMNSFIDTSVDDLDKHHTVNTRGVFLCYKYAALQMINQGRGGRIIGASSIAGKRGQEYVSAYVASKFAVRGLTQSAASELGQYGITVNAYAPGAIDTDMAKYFTTTLGPNAPDYTANPVGRIGSPEDIAELVSYLVSEKAGFVTGQSISINGGVYFD